MNLSLSSGEASQSALGRSPGLGFVLLAAPSHPSSSLRTVAVACGFRRHHSGGTAPDLHRTSLEALERRVDGTENYTERSALSRNFRRCSVHLVKAGEDSISGSATGGKRASGRPSGFLMPSKEAVMPSRERAPGKSTGRLLGLAPYWPSVGWRPGAILAPSRADFTLYLWPFFQYTESVLNN